MTHNFAPVRYSYGDSPEQDRAAIWCEVVARKVFRAECEPLGDESFDAEVTHRALPGLGIVTVQSSGQRLIRTSELVAQGSDQFWLSITRSGTVVAAQCDREVNLGEGDATLISYADPLTLMRPQPGKSLGLLIPFATLAPLVSKIGDAIIRPIPRNTEALRLLTGYLDLLQQDYVLASIEIGQFVVAHVHDLVACAIGATREAADIASGRGVRAARFYAIKSDIGKNIQRHELSAEWIAARHAISPSSVRRLFEEDATTFSEFVLDHRLLQAHRLLRDPRHFQMTISAIAFAIGFGDLSYFNRTFRRRYDATPSDVRKTVRRGNEA